MLLGTFSSQAGRDGFFPKNFLSDIQIPDRNDRLLPGENWAECGNISPAYGTKVQTLNGNVVLQMRYIRLISMVPV